MATLRESTLALIGILKLTLALDKSSLESPAASFPIRNATAPKRFASWRRRQLSRFAATMRTPQCRIDLKSGFASTPLNMGNRKIAPPQALTTLGFEGLTVDFKQITDAALSASAVRRMVPKLPGSCSPHATTDTASGRSSTASSGGG